MSASSNFVFTHTLFYCDNKPLHNPINKDFSCRFSVSDWTILPFFDRGYRHDSMVSGNSDLGGQQDGVLWRDNRRQETQDDLGDCGRAVSQGRLCMEYRGWAIHRGRLYLEDCRLAVCQRRLYLIDYGLANHQVRLYLRNCERQVRQGSLCLGDRGRAIHQDRLYLENHGWAVHQGELYLGNCGWAFRQGRLYLWDFGWAVCQSGLYQWW